MVSSTGHSTELVSKGRDLCDFRVPPPADISTVLCDNQSKVETLLKTREEGQIEVLKTVVVMDDFSPQLVERGAQCGVEVVSLQDVEVRRTTASTLLSDRCTVADPLLLLLQAQGKSRLQVPVVSHDLIPRSSTFSAPPFFSRTRLSDWLTASEAAGPEHHLLHQRHHR